MSLKLKLKGSEYSGTLYLSSTDQIAHGFQQILNSKWFLKALQSGFFKKLLRLGIDHVPRYKQEAMFQRRLHRFDLPVQALSAEPGHQLIANNQVVIVSLDVFQSFRT